MCVFSFQGFFLDSCRAYMTVIKEWTGLGIRSFRDSGVLMKAANYQSVIQYHSLKDQKRDYVVINGRDWLNRDVDLLGGSIKSFIYSSFSSNN